MEFIIDIPEIIVKQYESKGIDLNVDYINKIILDKMPKKRVIVSEKVLSDRQLLLNEGINEDLIRQWLKIRKAKNVTLTELGLNSIKNQAAIAKISLEDAITFSCAASWAGFKAVWYENNKDTIAPLIENKKAIQTQELLETRRKSQYSTDKSKVTDIRQALRGNR